MKIETAQGRCRGRRKWHQTWGLPTAAEAAADGESANMSSPSGGTKPRAARLPTGREILWIAAAAIVYFVTARLSLRILFAPEGIAAIWPPEGVYLSAILLTRREVRPWLVVVLFATDLSAEILAGTSVPVGAVYALALTGSAVFGSWLLLKYVGPRIDFGRVRDLIGFLGLSVVLSNATMSLLAAAAATTVPGSLPYWRSWALWAASDGVGNLIVTPLILSWATLRSGELRALRPPRALEGLALLLSLSLTSFFAFRYMPGHGDAFLILAYVAFPFLIWAALRFGARGTSAALALLAMVAIESALEGRLNTVIAVQLYVASAAVPSLFLAADVSERQREHRALLERDEQLGTLNVALEDRVARRTQDLAGANRELEAFVYAVSHDLRAPLRAVDGFSYAILEDYGDRLDAKGASHLERIRQAAQHMSELIDALLMLSRVGRRDMEPAVVDLSAAARRLAAELADSEPDRRVDVTVREGLTAWADAGLVDVILRNLLANAWKFSSTTPQAHIAVGSMQQGDECVFFVRDNGAGFDPAYSDKLFTPFQRLHSTSEFHGSGIGLATVQRAVARHGGRCWLEGAVGEGATGYFTLPGAPANDSCIRQVGTVSETESQEEPP